MKVFDDDYVLLTELNDKDYVAFTRRFVKETV